MARVVLFGWTENAPARRKYHESGISLRANRAPRIVRPREARALYSSLGSCQGPLSARALLDPFRPSVGESSAELAVHAQRPQVVSNASQTDLALRGQISR